MRFLVVIFIIVIIGLYYLNGHYLPSRQDSAKKIVDRHISSLLIGDAEEISYLAHVKIYPQEVYVENLHIDAGKASWDRIWYQDVLLDVARIEYDAVAAIWRRKLEIDGIKGVTFQCFFPYDQIIQRFDRFNDVIVDPTLRYDEGHLFLRAYFSPFQDKLELDGDLILTPTGDIKYVVKKIYTVDGEEQKSSRVRRMIEDTTNFVAPVTVMDIEIELDKIEMLKDGIWISGKSNDEETIDT